MLEVSLAVGNSIDAVSRLLHGHVDKCTFVYTVVYEKKRVGFIRGENPVTRLRLLNNQWLADDLWHFSTQFLRYYSRLRETSDVPSRNLGPPENSLAAYSLCKCTSRHSPSTSSKTIREIDCQWAHSVRSSSLPIEHPKPPFDHKRLLTWPAVTSCRFPLANITLHNLPSSPLSFMTWSRSSLVGINLPTLRGIQTNY